MTGARLVARSLLRSWQRQRLRAIASLSSLVVGIILATFVTSMAVSIIGALRNGAGIGSIDAPLVAKARNSSGMTLETARALAAAVGPDDAAPIVLVQTEVSGPHGSPLLIVGGTPSASGFVPGGINAVLPKIAPHPGTVGLVLGASWVRAHHSGTGDEITLVTPNGAEPFTIVGIDTEPLPNSGAVAIGAIDQIDAAFDRTDRADAVYFKLPSGMTAAALKKRLLAIAPGTITVGTPAQVAKPDENAFETFRAVFIVAGLAGLAVAAAVLLVCWRLLLEDERANLARFRLAGAGMSDLALGSGAVFAGAAIVSTAVGLPLGFLVTTQLDPLFTPVLRLVGLAGVASTAPSTGTVLGGASAGLVMCAVAWALGMRSFAKLPAASAVRGVLSTPARAITPGPFLGAAVAATVAGWWALRSTPVALAFLPLVFAAGSVLMLALGLPALIGKVLGRGRSFVRMSVGREYETQARRRSAMVIVFGMALLLSITLTGLSSSIGRSTMQGFKHITHNDLFVAPTSTGLSLRDERMSPAIVQTLKATPGVAAVTPMSLSFTTIAGKLVQIWSWDATTAADTVEFTPSSGARGSALWSALAAGKLAVSKAFAYQHRLHVGDQLTVPALTGTYTATVVSIIPDYLTDNGTIYTSLGVFHRLTGDDRLHHVSIRLSPGASPAVVTAAIKAELPQYPDMVVFTAVGLRTELMAIVTRVLTVLRALALAALVLAILVGAATTTASLAARRAPLALSRVIGATSAVLRRQLATECVLVGVAGWLVALPAGLLGIGAAVHAVGAKSGMLPPVAYPTVQILALLPLSIAAATVAMWLPTRSLLKTSILEAVRYE